MRRVAHHLMPETLVGAGLKQSLADYCNSIPGATFNYYGDETRFDPKREAMLYRAAHELVTNALKHSGATHILVQIVKEADIIALTVQDNGCGFDPAAVSKGMGLTNIRNRVAAFNGNLMIDAKPGVGTEINVELQL
jgi:signal transduction histidine kinase